MKGIAICAMLCHHLYGCPPEGVEPYTGVLAWIGVLGKVCVALFLFCSGYGLAANYTPVSIKDDLKFIGHRLVKFYLNYWVIFLIFVPITILCFHRPLSTAYGEEHVWGHLILDILGMQGYASYNITWWFNTLVIILYLLFPMLYRAVQWKPWVAIVLGMVVMRLSTHVSFDSLDIMTFQFPFILGIVWNMYETKAIGVQEWIATNKMVTAGISLGLLAIIVIIRMYPIIPHWFGIRIDGFVTCAIALCLITILRCNKYLMSSFAFLGKHSMNIYMTHTFFYVYWHPEWLHACEWLRGGGFAILLSICLAISIMLEYIKEKVGVYKLMKIITDDKRSS